jgi:alkylated DNA nucleotide flippase Atl1
MRLSATLRTRVFWSVCVGACLLVWPVTTGAWGMDVHRLITARALDGMPPEIKSFFAADRAFIVEHSVDPDLWRIMDLRGERGEEPPNHFLDMDFEEGSKPPFLNIPRDFDEYVKKYGAGPATRYGRLPWRAEEVYNRLVASLRDVGKPNVPYAADNARYALAALAHYIEDAHVPFHAVINYDGQLTNQRGVHARFETELILRNQKTLKLAPVKAVVIPGSFRDYMFQTLVDSQALVEGVLSADLKAAQGREFYDDVYFAAFLKGARATAERRLSEAASAVASAALTAWNDAGKPVLPADGPRSPARIRR